VVRAVVGMNFLSYAHAGRPKAGSCTAAVDLQSVCRQSILALSSSTPASRMFHARSQHPAAAAAAAAAVVHTYLGSEAVHRAFWDELLASSAVLGLAIDYSHYVL